MKLTLAQLAHKVDNGKLSPDTLILPWTTADQVVGWLYHETDSTPVSWEYADAGEYEVLSAETARALAMWRSGGPSPFENEMLCLSIRPASYIIWKAQQDFLSGGA